MEFSCLGRLLLQVTIAVEKIYLLSMQGSGIKIRNMERVNVPMQMVQSTKVTINKTNWTVTEPLFGQQVSLSPTIMSWFPM